LDHGNRRGKGKPADREGTVTLKEKEAAKVKKEENCRRPGGGISSRGKERKKRREGSRAGSGGLYLFFKG